MMGRLKHTGLLLLLLLSFSPGVRAQKTHSLVLADDHLVLLIDLHSSSSTLDSLLKNAGIENADAKMIKNGNYATLQKQGWRVTKMGVKLLRIDRSLGYITPGEEMRHTSTLTLRDTTPGYPNERMYGVNNFAQITVHELPNGQTRFFLPGNTRAKRVMLSGNFNNWSTLQGVMLKTDSGWVKDMSLEPGVYAYKFIIDGRWTTDRNNNLWEDDGAGNTNSIYYRYNYSFKLPGYADAHRVIVAGSFNKWNTGQLIMNHVGNGWELKLYLHDGMHLYHFLVDGKVVTDPDNRLTGKDNAGNQSSILKLGETINFKLGGYAGAHKVYLAGSFNNWLPDELAMVKVNGSWILPYTFAAGNYQYKFIVDGHWITDPANPHQVGSGDTTNSILAVKPNYTFHLKGHGDAKAIRLSGTFNNWNQAGYTMEHKGDEWVISLFLKPGKYLYKFIVDGNWILDPGNRFWEQNEFHNGNSVLWIEPGR